MPKRIVLDDYVSKLRDERSIEIMMRDGQVFKIDPPQLWPDAIKQVENAVEQAQLLLGGEEAYAQFVAAGGNAQIINAMIADGFEADVPE